MIVHSDEKLCDFTKLLQAGETPLHRAAGKGSPAVAELLIRAKADINVRDDVSAKFYVQKDLLTMLQAGNSPILLVSSHSLLELFIKAEADINVKNNVRNSST